MKTVLKRTAKTAFRLAKKAAHSNKHTRRFAKSVKQTLQRVVANNDQREIYNLSSFYPTIPDYYQQTKQYSGKNAVLISILMPTYNTPEQYLRECIESIIVQSYPHWELCIADDNSPDKSVVEIIKEYQKQDSRIKLIERKENGHISLATNSALEIASGDFVALMDHDDVLWPNALHEMVAVIEKDKKVDFIYSDEDKIDGTGKIHSYPFLKPDFSPEFLESCNYITHFSCIRMSVMKQVGGFRKGYEGAQDWDLFIRIGEITHNIVHIPKILYSWRIHEASTASDTDAKPYVYEAQRKLLVDHIERTHKNGTVETGIIRQHRTIKYAPAKDSLLSVVIRHTTFEATERLVRSMAAHPAGAPYEVIYASSKQLTESELSRLQELLGDIKQQSIVVSVAHRYQDAIKKSAGTSLLFVADVAVIMSDNWASIALADSQIESVGCVFPVVLDASGKNVMSAGVGVGYGPTGYEDMLRGMPFEDPHYTRGLYAKSRRNIGAGNEVAFVAALPVAEKLAKIPGFYVACQALINEGYRHIYSPYIQVTVDTLPEAHETTIADGRDGYLNPNFNSANPRMEVKA